MNAEIWSELIYWPVLKRDIDHIVAALLPKALKGAVYTLKEVPVMCLVFGFYVLGQEPYAAGI